MTTPKKKSCRHVWKYQENTWKRNVCTKCGIFQKFDPVLNPRRKETSMTKKGNGELERCRCGHKSYKESYGRRR